MNKIQYIIYFLILNIIYTIPVLASTKRMDKVLLAAITWFLSRVGVVFIVYAIGLMFFAFKDGEPLLRNKAWKIIFIAIVLMVLGPIAKGFGLI